jgi:hypothetical protein
VDDDEVGVLDEQARVFGGVEDGGAEIRVGGVVGLQTFIAMVVQQVLEAPRACGLESGDGVALGRQFAQGPAQEMGVAVVPAALQRMREVGDPHAATASAVGSSVR